MKDLFPVRVVVHSGYQADEYPKSFYYESARFDIEEIIDRWYQVSYTPEKPEPEDSFKPASYFKVRTSDDKIYILKHETETDQWFLLIKGESTNLNHSTKSE